jgi:anti-sigma factor RsiW
MTGIDPFTSSDAAYVLGALDGEERRAFEAHLLDCPDCQARVDEARETLAMLSVLPTAADGGTWVPEPESPPDTLLPSLLRTARRSNRRRWALTAVGTAVAACLAALAIVLTTGGSGPSQPPAQALSAVQPSVLTASARLVPRAWGTQIDLHCAYPSSDRDRFAYNLVVIDRSNRSHHAGDWTLVPGKAGIDFQGGTSVPKDQIAKVQITTTTGVPLLELRL